MWALHEQETKGKNWKIKLNLQTLCWRGMDSSAGDDVC